jgi:molecular chaperone GrpE
MSKNRHNQDEGPEDTSMPYEHDIPEVRPEDLEGFDMGDADVQISQLEGQIADLDAKWKRALADAQNTRRQSRINETEAAFQGARRVLEGIIPVLDHFELALGQDAEAVSAEQIMGGVRLIRDELLKALASHNVTTIAPRPGDEFDPNRHEAMMREPTTEVAPGTISKALQVGYAMGDRTLRPAKVIIAQSPEGGA